jgi:chorismate mutase
MNASVLNSPVLNGPVRNDPVRTDPVRTDPVRNDPSPAVNDMSSSDSHIAALRHRIDEIDRALIELWRERAAISLVVGATRVAAGGTRLVLAREQEILARFREALGEDGTQLAMLILRAGRGRLV